MSDEIKYSYSDKQREFCREYILDFNGTRAYYRAGYTAKNDAVAAVQAHRLLEKEKIQALIEELLADRRAKRKYTEDRIFDKLEAIAFAQITDVVSWDSIPGEGILIKVEELDEFPYELKQAIKSVKKTKDGFVIEMYDALKAIDELTNLLGINRQKQQVEHHHKQDGNWTIKIVEVGADGSQQPFQFTDDSGADK